MPVPPPFRARTAAFGLLEVLVVIAIIAVLGALLIPTAGRMMNKARGVVSIGNLRQIHTICSQYAVDRNGDYPVFFRDNVLPPGKAEWDYWYQVVRKTLSPETSVYKLAALDIRGSVLWSKSAEKDWPATIDTYAGNMNLGYHPTLVPTQKLGLVYRGATTVMFADVIGKTRILTPTYNSTFGKLNARNGASSDYAMDGVAHVIFLDGHGATLTARECSALNADRTNAFWGDRLQ